MKQNSVTREVGGKIINSGFSPEIKAVVMLKNLWKTHEVCEMKYIKYKMSVFHCLNFLTLFPMFF